MRSLRGHGPHRRHRTVLGIVAASLLAVGARHAATTHAAAPAPLGAEEWFYLAPGGGPSGRQGASLSYDAARQRMILFGGFDGFREQNDVWELALPDSGALTWRKLTPAGKAPAGRDEHVAVFDAQNDRLVVFGGQDRGTTTYYSDLHFLRLTPGAEEWTTPPVTEAPTSRASGVGVYDAAGARLVLFGGYDGTADLGDVWTLALPRAGQPVWQRLMVAGGIAPAPSDGMVGVLDTTGHRMLVYGGLTRWTRQYNTDVFALSLDAGTESWLPLTTGLTTGPLGRIGASGVYEPAGGRLVILGGSNQMANLTDAWAFDVRGGSGWTRLEVAGGPGHRGGPATAYDAANGRMILVGGYAGSFSYADDIWGLRLEAHVPTATPSATSTSTPTATATPTRAAPSATPSTTARSPKRVLLPYLLNVLPPLPTGTPTPPPCIEEEREPNRTLTDADKNPDLCPDVTVSGVVPPGDDWDFYRIEVRRDGVVDVDLWNLPPRTDYDLYLVDYAGATIAKSDLASTNDEHISVPVSAGRYYLWVYPREQRSPQAYRLRWFLN